MRYEDHIQCQQKNALLGENLDSAHKEIAALQLKLLILEDKLSIARIVCQESEKEGCSDYFTFKDAQILIKHHFDLFNLIKKGIAIDINEFDVSIY